MSSLPNFSKHLQHSIGNWLGAGWQYWPEIRLCSCHWLQFLSLMSIFVCGATALYGQTCLCNTYSARTICIHWDLSWSSSSFDFRCATMVIHNLLFMFMITLFHNFSSNVLLSLEFLGNVTVFFFMLFKVSRNFGLRCFANVAVVFQSARRALMPPIDQSRDWGSFYWCLL